MSSPGTPDTTPAIGAVVVAPDGGRIGQVVAVALDVDTAQPDWLVLEVDPSAHDDRAHRTALPSYVASLTAGGELSVPFTRDLVRQAPPAESDVLDEVTAQAVLEHYGLTA